MTTVSVTTTLDVDIDLAEITDDELRDECASRGLHVASDITEDLFMALKMGRKEAVYEICRAYMQELKGVVL
jgi:hypothetical protein